MPKVHDREAMEAKVQEGVRDLSTFSDTRMVKTVLRATMVYLALGAMYFAWFFSRYACGGPESPCSWDPTARVNTTSLYPNNDGAGSLTPLLDAIIFMLSVFTTVGWGSQPTDLTTRHERDDTRNHSMLFDSTKLLLCLLSFVGVAAIGLILGTTGSTFRAMCRKKLHDRVAQAVRKQHRMMLKARKSKNKPAEAVTSAHEHSSLLEDHDHLIAVLMLALCIMMGTVAFTITETECVQTADVKEICREGEPDQKGGWQYLNFVDALYLTVISVSTVGFGDYAPSTTASKIFTMIYLPVAVGFTANAIDHVSSYLINKRVGRLENFVLGQYGGTEDRGVGSRDAGGAGLTAYDFEELQRSVELDHTKPLSRNDFRLAMLMRLARVQPGDLKKIDEVFTLLDPDRNGMIEPPWTDPDLSGWMQKKKKRAENSPFMWRWFELRGGDLSYFDHKDSVERKGNFRLRKGAEIRPVKLNKKQKLAAPLPSSAAAKAKKIDLHKFGIEIEEGGGVFSLCCETNVAREAWITALKKAVADLERTDDNLTRRVTVPTTPNDAAQGNQDDYGDDDDEGHES